MTMVETDERYMLLASNLAKSGFPAPNPRVGCVIVNDGRIVGTGFHDHAGGPHAEIVAIRNAGSSARGSTVYVTLEPCSHHGKTPPCVDALIDARVKKVVFACNDPNPRASGGAKRLREAGVVTVGRVGEEFVRKVNWVFHLSHALGRPVVIVKAAVTMDGYMAQLDGTSKWITGAGARRRGHWLRANLGSVLVGRATVQVDDPQLTARIPGVVNQPLRIILDPSCRLTGSERVFNEPGEVKWFVNNPAKAGQAQFPQGPGRLRQLLEALPEVHGILVEGGPKTIRHFFEEGLVDGVELFVSPKIFGSGLRFEPGIRDMEGFRLLDTLKIGQDFQVSYRRSGELFFTYPRH
jgi:diaminohydroxyphosphoribosylaminopyrimidine deaminase/5-amino-6-(5-phosphoribosylamino)uracil reductase